MIIEIYYLKIGLKIVAVAVPHKYFSKIIIYFNLEAYYFSGMSPSFFSAICYFRPEKYLSSSERDLAGWRSGGTMQYSRCSVWTKENKLSGLYNRWREFTGQSDGVPRRNLEPAAERYTCWSYLLTLIHSAEYMPHLVHYSTRTFINERLLPFLRMPLRRSL